ncbi:hypothetical protein SXM_3503 [Shewanella xiamenensis]|nr:hypothetical protein SXM_3503 [Shewanella xiamenensis]
MFLNISAAKWQKQICFSQGCIVNPLQYKINKLNAAPQTFNKKIIFYAKIA